MDFIKDATTVGSLPALPDLTGLTPGYYTEGNPGIGQPATRVRAWHLNLTMLEIVHVIQAAGITLDPSNSAQLLLALQAMFAPIGGGGGGGGGGIGQFVADTGTSGHIVVAPGTALTPADGDLLLIKLGNDIAAATDIAVSGHAAIPLVTAANAATQGGEGKSGRKILVEYSAVDSEWRILASDDGNLASQEPAASHHVATKNYVDAALAASALRSPTLSWGSAGPSAATYYFVGKARTNGTIDGISYNCGTAGASFTVNIQKNGTSVTSLGAVVVNSTTTGTTAANGGTPVPYVIGDEIRVVITAPSTAPIPANAFVQLNHTAS